MRVSQQFNRHMAAGSILQRIMPVATTSYAIHVALFSGVPPTDDQLLALMNTANISPTWSAANIAGFATAANFLADVSLLSVMPALDVDQMVLTIPLSSQTNMFTVASSGTPTWFMLRTCNATSSTDTFAGFTSGTSANVIITGTVGDENSTADLKILGGAVTAGSPVRAADLRIKF